MERNLNHPQGFLAIKTSGASATRHPWFLLFSAGLLVIAIARPWTIRPIVPVTSLGMTSGGMTSSPFDPSSYVSSIWDTRIISAASSSATDLARALREAQAAKAPARAMLVSGTGVVTSVDTRSRVGLAHVDLAPGDGQPDAVLQIGPVLRGTVLRDAVGFIRFEDFANQIDYARVAGALNTRVLETVLRDVGKADALRGRTIEFRGAALVGAATPEIVPVTLQVSPATTQTTKGAAP
jgi:predicted lipoprotein